MTSGTTWLDQIKTKPNVNLSPLTDSRLWFTGTGPEEAELIAYVPPESPQIPMHRHPMIERFTILKGELEVFCDGRWHQLTAGKTIIVPPGKVHSFRNRSAEPCYYAGRVTPGGRFLDLMRLYGALVEARKVTSLCSLRSLIYLGLLYDSFRDVQIMTGPVGAILYGLGAVGRKLGYRLPEPSSFRRAETPWVIGPSTV